MAYRVPAGHFGSHEACRLAGITHRQLDHWTKTLGPAFAQPVKVGSGTHRTWAPIQVACLRLIGLLRDAGVSDTALIENALEGFLTSPPGVDCLAVTDGGECVYMNADTLPRFLNTKRCTSVLAIHLPILWRDLWGTS
jgi:hypothetical protein